MDQVVKPLHLIVSDERHFVTINKSDMESFNRGNISYDAWDSFINLCHEAFGQCADFIDITDEIGFQNEDLEDKHFLFIETRRFLMRVYSDSLKYVELQAA